MLAALACAGGSIAYVLRGSVRGGWAIGLVAVGLALAGAAGLLAKGLLTRARWARFALLGVSVLGLFTPFFVPAAVVLMYMLRHDVGVVFSGQRDWAELSPEEADILRQGARETAFTGVIAASTLLAVLGTAFLVTAARREPARPAAVEADEAAAIAQVRSLIGAQDSFRGGTCGNGYADWTGLTNPASVIPRYPADARPFLDPDAAPAERAGYRFELTVEEPIPPAEGCPSRSFGRYRYSATPVTGKGRAFLGGPDRVIHVATGRAATTDDPALP
jgi:hypothetical protein